MIRLSIILPVYNVELYLERCLRSLLDQDIPQEEYEIIVVNDGSPDNSREVAIRLMNEASNIILIDQVNRGVSMARNAGLDRARGEYVLFIDPDDYVVKNSLREILIRSDKIKPHVLVLGYQFLDVNDKLVSELLYRDHSTGAYTGVDAYFIARADSKIDPDRSVGILYHRLFIEENGLRYVGGMPYLEDGEFLARVMALSERCMFSGTPFYIRTTRPGSATNSKLYNSQVAIDGFVKAAFHLKEFQRKARSEKIKRFLHQPVAKFTLLSVQASVYGSLVATMTRLISIRKRLRRHQLLRLNLVDCVPIYRRLGSLYNISIFLFAFLWSFYLLGIKLKSVLVWQKR